MPDPHTTHSDNSHDSRARLAMRSVAEVCRIPSSKPNVRRRQTSKKMKTSVSAVTKRHNLPSEHAFVKQRSCSSVPYFPPVFLDEDDDSFPA